MVVIESGRDVVVEITKKPYEMVVKNRYGFPILREHRADTNLRGWRRASWLGYRRGPDGTIVATFDALALAPDEHIYGLGEKFMPLGPARPADRVLELQHLGRHQRARLQERPVLRLVARLRRLPEHHVQDDLGRRQRRHHVDLDPDRDRGRPPRPVLHLGPEDRGHPDPLHRADRPPAGAAALVVRVLAVEVHATVAGTRSGRSSGRPARSGCRPTSSTWTRPGCASGCTPISSGTRRGSRTRPATWPGLREEGIRICLWLQPWIPEDSEVFAEGQEHGAFATREDGSVYFYAPTDPGPPPEPLRHRRLLQPDRPRVVHPEDPGPDRAGRQRLQDRFRRGDPRGRRLRQRHARLGDAQPVSRCSTTPPSTRRSSAAAGPTTWSAGGAPAGPASSGTRSPGAGTMLCNFPSMVCTLWSGLSFSLSGVAFWSHDIGGFMGETNPELYVRWAQWGLLSSHSRAHGTTSREPWSQGEQALSIFREFDELRYQLHPVPVQPGPRGPPDRAAADAADGAGVPGRPGHPHDRQPVPARPEPAGGAGPGGGADVAADVPAARHLVQLLDGHAVRGWPLDPPADAVARDDAAVRQGRHDPAARADPAAHRRAGGRARRPRRGDAAGLPADRCRTRPRAEGILHEDGGTTTYVYEDGTLTIEPEAGAPQARTYTVEVVGRDPKSATERTEGAATIEVQ